MSGTTPAGGGTEVNIGTDHSTRERFTTTYKEDTQRARTEDGPHPRLTTHHGELVFHVQLSNVVLSLPKEDQELWYRR